MQSDSELSHTSVRGHPNEGFQPLVSIVVPTKDRPESLSRLLESLRQLAYPRSQFEILVVGGELDEGRGVVSKFGTALEGRARYHTVPERQGHSASFKRNAGARKAVGDVLAFTDDDCEVHRNWLTAAVHHFDSPEVGGVESAVEIPKPDRPTLTYKGLLRLTLPRGFQTCSMFYRRSVFEECEGFDPHFPYYLEDTDLAYTVLERGYKIPFAADAVVFHPVPPPRPLKLLTMAGTVEQMPYLFFKHPRSKLVLQESIKPFNRSHYVYLILYLSSLAIALVRPAVGVLALVSGLCVLLPLQLLHDFRGLRFTVRELALTAVCQMVVPVTRAFFWLKGITRVALIDRTIDLAK